MIKYLILGAGSAGLTFANSLLDKGIKDFLVLEKEPEAGGLCRSTIVDGYPLDIGGGHFLDVRRPKVNEFLFRFLPENEWNLFKRDSRIQLENEVISHPIEANIWQMDKPLQDEYLKSISEAGCNNNIEAPTKFIDWIYWKLGSKIADDYMIPYNQKMFGNNLNELGTYWLDKLPNVSYEETKLSCINKKPFGSQPGHASFYYPKKYGYGELWKRMADNLGQNIKYNKSVKSLDFDNLEVISDDGECYYAENIITTIPWESIAEKKNLPVEIINALSDLKHTSVEIAYYSDNLETDAQWIYYPDKNLSYHRILVRKNFCIGSSGYWTETNIDRIQNNSDAKYNYVNEYAYPLNTLNKPKTIKTLLDYAKTKHIYGLGRWGEHEHYNSDKTVERALELSEELIKQ